MGGLTEWRDLFFKWMAARGETGCFHQTLPDDAPAFSVVIVDAMQELASFRHLPESEQTGASIERRLAQGLYPHLCNVDWINGGNPVRDSCQTTRLLVVCFDSVYNVPRNKAFVEAERDQKSGSGTRSAIPIDSMDHRAMCARFAETRNLANFSEFRDFLIDHGPLPIDGSRVWRNTTMRWQLQRFVTSCIAGFHVPPGKAILVDDALVLSSTQYAELAARMLAEHGYDDGHHSPYEQAVLVSHLMSGAFRRLFIEGGDDTRFAQLPHVKIGESDHKMLYYVQRTPPAGFRGPSSSDGAPPRLSYLVKCQDTDVLFQLLHHVQAALINPATGMVDEVDLWLDTQTPSDRARGISRPYRFVNVVALWRAFHRAFRADFPSVRNPMETFLFLIFCRENDFVEGFARPVRVSAGAIWAAFGHLQAEGGFPLFSDPSRRVYPGIAHGLARHRGLFNDAMLCSGRPGDAEPIRNPIRPTTIAVKPAVAEHFFYLLIQQSPALGKIAREFKVDLMAPTDPDQFRTLCDHLRRCCGEGTRAADDVAAAVPTRAAMGARIARVNWTLEYYTNAWKFSDYTHNWASKERGVPVYGWTTEEVTHKLGTISTSQYLYALYTGSGPPAGGQDVYRFYEPRRATETTTSW